MKYPAEVAVGLWLLLTLIALLLAVGCNINHVLSGDAFVHVDAEDACQWEEEVTGPAISCDDGRLLACLNTETEGNYVCQKL